MDFVEERGRFIYQEHQREDRQGHTCARRFFPGCKEVALQRGNRNTKIQDTIRATEGVMLVPIERPPPKKKQMPHVVHGRCFGGFFQ